MKQIIISCLITAVSCIAFSVIFGLVMKPTIEDHSKRFQEIEAQNELVRKSELRTFDDLKALYRIYTEASIRIDSLQSVVKTASSKLFGYEKQLAAIKAGMKTTNYQDSSKVVILKNLPK